MTDFTAHFDGKTYDSHRDHIRLKGQMLAVFDVMSDGRWRTLTQLAFSAHAPEASVSARLRDLRKDKFGGYEVLRDYVENGLHRYRLVLPPREPEQLDLLAITSAGSPLDAAE